MTTCKNCGGEIADTAKFCLKCGTKVEHHPFCPNCGTELKPNTKFCPSCGTALIRQTQMPGVQSASKNQGLFSYGQNFSSNTNTLPKNERSFNLWQKFFTLLVVFGYFMPVDRRFLPIFHIIIRPTLILRWCEDWDSRTILFLGYLLLSLSVICAGLTLIFAIAYQIGKKPAIKTFSTSIHFLGFFLFAAGILVGIAIGIRLQESVVFSMKRDVFIMLAGWIISSIPIGGKNDNV